MLTQFTQATLVEWRNDNIKFLLTEEIPCMSETDDLAEFIIYPIRSEEELQSLMLHKTRGVPFNQHQTIAAYDINNPEVTELAEGIPYCKYYIQAQNLRNAA